MKKKQDIKEFYNKNANKFAQTRNKFWPEFEYIKQEVSKIIWKNWKIKILELGCGSWRLYTYLIENFPQEKIDYVGIDISENLIDIAKKTWWYFEVDDMLSFLEKQEQQSFDFVVAIASFQHIFLYKERLLIMKNIYRILQYEWKVMMFNWSFSHWFFKKYTIQIFKAFMIWILSLFTKPINDIFIPWKQERNTYYRYYHIFFLFELKKLLKLSSFIVQELCYISKNWEKTLSRKQARNTMFIWKKWIM